MNVLAGLVLLVCEFWLDKEGVSTEVITLSLEEVGWEVLGTVTVEPVKSSGESWSWYTECGSLADNLSPTWLSLVNSLVEEVVEEQVLEVGVVTVSLGDILQEDGSDNASTTPHESNGWLVKLPLVFPGSLQVSLVSRFSHHECSARTSCINMKPCA